MCVAWHVLVPPLGHPLVQFIETNNLIVLVLRTCPRDMERGGGGTDCFAPLFALLLLLKQQNTVRAIFTPKAPDTASLQACEEKAFMTLC